MQVWLHYTKCTKVFILHRFALKVSTQILTRDSCVAFLLQQIYICHIDFRAIYSHNETNLTNSWRTQQQEYFKVRLVSGRCNKEYQIFWWLITGCKPVLEQIYYTSFSCLRFRPERDINLCPVTIAVFAVFVSYLILNYKINLNFFKL